MKSEDSKYEETKHDLVVKNDDLQLLKRLTNSLPKGTDCYCRFTDTYIKFAYRVANWGDKKKDKKIADLRKIVGFRLMEFFYANDYQCVFIRFKK